VFKKLGLVAVVLAVVGAVAVGCVPPSGEAAGEQYTGPPTVGDFPIINMVILYSGGVPVKVWENVSGLMFGEASFRFITNKGNKVITANGSEIVYVEFKSNERDQILKEYGLLGGTENGIK